MIDRDEQIKNADKAGLKAGRDIVLATIDGELHDCLVALESCCALVLLAMVRLGGDNAVCDVLFEGVRERMAKIRLEDIEPHGKA